MNSPNSLALSQFESATENPYLTTLLRQRELFNKLERAGIKAYELKPDELRRLLVGGHTSIPLDLTLIPLRSTSEQSLKTFRALFINLLHMREITAATPICALLITISLVRRPVV